MSQFPNYNNPPSMQSGHPNPGSQIGSKVTPQLPPPQPVKQEFRFGWVVFMAFIAGLIMLVLSTGCQEQTTPLLESAGINNPELYLRLFYFGLSLIILTLIVKLFSNPSSED